MNAPKKPEYALQNQVVDAAIEVHRALGPDLLESTYESCFVHELQLRNLKVQKQKTIPVNYKSAHVPQGYRIDILVENKIVVEVKSVQFLSRLHESQLFSYLKLSGYSEGYLINFNVFNIFCGIFCAKHYTREGENCCRMWPLVKKNNSFKQ